VFRLGPSCLLAFVTFQILALEKRRAGLFDWLEYVYYFLGAVGIALFFVAELHEVTTLKIDTRGEKPRPDVPRWLSAVCRR